MTALATVASWLRCPVCAGSMTLDERSLRCDHGHAFDVAKQGYVNLLGHGAPQHADSAEMVAARQRFLHAGWYSPIADAVRDALSDANSVVEVGAGTGYYLAHALRAGATGLATDISVPACRRAAKVDARVAAVVADTWAGLPLRDACVDAVLCVFAPRNMPEFQRVLRPGGRVCVVVPNEGHLAELREAEGLLNIDGDKAERLTASLADATTTRLRFPLDLDAEAATDLVGMGPNAFHQRQVAAACATTVDVSVVVGSFA